MGTTTDKHTDAAVYAYAPGSTTPTKTIATFARGDFPLGLGLDSANDLYVGINHPAKGSQPRGRVLEFASGSSSGKNLGIRVGQAGGLTVDKNDDLLIVDESANAVDVFPPGHKHWSKQITIGGNCCIYDLALNHANDELWVTSGFWGKIYGVTYPGGQVVDTISRHTGWAWGVATYPSGTN
jgi:hypothetical protein